MATPFIVTAIHTFVAEHSDELEFTAGERIEIIEKDDAFGDGWWKVRLVLWSFEFGSHEHDPRPCMPLVSLNKAASLALRR
jgi:hypothetical protein